MAKYHPIKLKVKNRELIGLDKLRGPESTSLEERNVVYIYRGSKSKKVYIGQTKEFTRRHKEHYDRSEEKFETADFDEVIVLISSLFQNKSAIEDVEAQLITYFTADNPNARKQMVEYDLENKLTNKTGGNSVNEYKEQESVASDVILPFWENVLAPEGWVINKTLEKLRNNVLVKYSPIKTLTDEQELLLHEIRSNSHKNFVVNGDPGTGKTVLLTHLVASLLREKNNKRIAVVVQPNWIVTAKKIFKVFGLDVKNKLTIETSITLINSGESYDIVIVDESHKLSRLHTKQHNTFNKVYKEQFANTKSHLEAIKKISSQVVLMYDVLQAIRPANITREQFAIETQGFERRFLKTQFRIQTPKGKSYTSDDFVNGIKYLLYKDTGMLEKTNFDIDFNRSVFHDKDPDSYFGFFESESLKNLIDWIEEDRNFNPTHINRVVAGLVEPWKQADGKNPSITHWHEGDIKRRWNSRQDNWVYSNDEDAEDQIGSVFAVQGIDLNKVGVLIGNDLQVDDNGLLFANPENFHNVNGKFSKDDDNPENEFEFTLFVLNIYYILMTRGIDGVRLGFWKNDSFKEYMKEVLDIS